MKVEILYFVPVERGPKILLSLCSITIFWNPLGEAGHATLNGFRAFKPAGTRRGGLDESVEPGDVTHHQVQPKGKKHVTTEAESPKVSFQTQRRGDRLGTCRDAIIQSSKREEQGTTLPFSNLNSSINQ